MFIKIENRFGGGVNTELIECDRYEACVEGEVNGMRLMMYKDSNLVAERNFVNQGQEELPQSDKTPSNKETSSFGKVLTIYIMNDCGETIDKIII